MNDNSSLMIYEPLESIENGDYWRIYVQGKETFRILDPNGMPLMDSEDTQKCEDYILRKSKIKIVDRMSPAAYPTSRKKIRESLEAIRLHKGTNKETIQIPQATYFTERGKTYINPDSGYSFEAKNVVPTAWFLLFTHEHQTLCPECKQVTYKRYLKEALEECRGRVKVLCCYTFMEPFCQKARKLTRQLSTCDQASYVILALSGPEYSLGYCEPETGLSVLHIQNLISNLKKGLIAEAIVEMEKLEAIDRRSKWLNLFQWR